MILLTALLPSIFTFFNTSIIFKYENAMLYHQSNIQKCDLGKTITTCHYSNPTAKGRNERL